MSPGWSPARGCAAGDVGDGALAPAQWAILVVPVMSATDSNPVTELLCAAAGGDAAAQGRLWEVIYRELHRVARSQLANDGCGLQATTLVHEVYLRLVGAASFENRRHFFAAAANAMRRIRVDYARMRKALKRGAGRRPADLDGGVLPVEADDPAALLALDEALARLEAEDAAAAEVVLLRYFAGLSIDETAETMGVSPRTVDMRWKYARAWLRRELSA